MSPATVAPDAAGPAGATVGAPAFAADRAWRLSPQVALRPERFGALAYHFGTRRLSFLKSPRLLALVETLGDHPSARAAAAALTADTAERGALLRALATLARTEMIVPREDA